MMIWSCMMQGKKGPLVVLEYPGGKGGGMDAQHYHDQVLAPHLLPFYEATIRDYGDVVYFQQDGARSHTARKTRAWLKRNEIRTLDHPARSPNLSPIERGWFLLKKRIRERPHTATSFEELKQAALEEWEKITEDELAAYTNMKGQVEAVIAADGGHTCF
jgi:hypothetical protein